MMRIILSVLAFIFGFLVGKWFYDKPENTTHEEIQVISNEIENLSKLVVSKGNFAEIYSFSDSKKYFYDYISFDKKAVVSVKANVEIGYDLNKLGITLDSINKKIIITEIPKEEVIIIPNIKYITLEDNHFNEFTPREHNKIRKKAISKIKETVELTSLKIDAKKRLMNELTSIFQLSKVYGWELVNDSSDMDLQDKIMFFNDTKIK